MRLLSILLSLSLTLLAAGDPVFHPSGKANLLFFVLTDCPISNSYAPEIQRICKEYSARGVACTLIYEDPKLQASTVRRHLEEFGYGSSTHTRIDTNRAIANQAKATVTPEVALIDASGELRYHGRIDNFYAALGKTRRHVTEHDLTDALNAVLAGKPGTHRETQALGCYIVPANP